MGTPYIWDTQRGETAFLSDEVNLPIRYHCFFPTKTFHQDPKADMRGIIPGLQWMAQTLSQFSIRRISFPALGCGLGGPDFEKDVLPLMIFFGNKFYNKKGSLIQSDLFVPQDLDSNKSKKLAMNQQVYTKCVNAQSAKELKELITRIKD